MLNSSGQRLPEESGRVEQASPGMRPRIGHASWNRPLSRASGSRAGCPPVALSVTLQDGTDRPNRCPGEVSGYDRAVQEDHPTRPTIDMHRTKIDLPQESREKLIELLNARLADAIDVTMQAKQAHWNVRGPSFFSLHQVFDKVSEEFEEYVDLLAERVAQLGGTVEGAIRLAAKHSVIAEYPLEITGGRAHVDALSTALYSFGRLARQAIAGAEGFDDADTADILTEVSRGTDQLLWLVEAHLQAEV